MCPEQPGNPCSNLAMKLGITPKRLPISLAPVLKGWRDGRRSSASSNAIAAS